MRTSSLQHGNRRSAVGGLFLAAICTGVTTTAPAIAGPEQIVVEVAAPWASASALNDTSRSIGLLVGVTIDGVPSCYGFGATVAGGDAVPDGSTIFQIGSVSKVYTGFILAQLVADGAVSLPDAVTGSLGSDLNAMPCLQGVTLGHLVAHYASLPKMPANLTDRDGDGLVDPGISPLSPAEDYSRANLADFLDTFVPAVAPGTQYRYSNVGSGLLALALADRGGDADFHFLLRRMVLDDLGLDSTFGRHAAIGATDLPRVAQGYALLGGQRTVGSLAGMGCLAGAGEVATTGTDLLAFLNVLIGIPGAGMSAAARLATTPLAISVAPDSIAYALDIISVDGARWYTKGGATPSYTSFIAFRRDLPLGVAVLSNCGGYTRVKSIALEILDRLGALATAIAEPPAPSLPTLAQNAPNPFNPATSITFTLPAACTVELRVHDLGGKLVRTLAAGVYPAGTHRSAWDGCDEDGRPATSGKYLCRLRTGGSDLSRGMVLVR